MFSGTGAPEQRVDGVAVLVWSADPERAAAMRVALTGVARRVLVAQDEPELVVQASAGMADLLLLDDDRSLDAQERFLRAPIILVIRSSRPDCRLLARRAYALVHRPEDASLAVERFQEHARLSALARARREPPRRCARCGRIYDPARAQHGGAQRFARFGSVSLCGGCIDALRLLLARATTPYIEAEV